MDSFTQAALGAVIGQAGFSRRLGRYAVWVGALAGVLPDFDIVSGLFGPWASMVHHRGATHSLLFAPLAAPLLGWAAWRLADGRSAAGRGPRRRDNLVHWMHLVFWALLTHPLLDWCTSYGTQLLWPLSTARHSIDAVMIVDPIYSLLLIAALVAGWLLRTRRHAPAWVAAVALVLSTSYLALGYVESRHARSLATAQLRAEGFEPVAVRAQPAMLLWMWRIVARNEAGELRVGSLSTWAPGTIAFESIPRPESPFVAAALASDRGRIFHWFADGMVGVRVEQRPDGTRVYLDDLRYGLVTRPTQPFWGAVAEFGPDGALRSVERHSARPRVGGELRAALAATWRMTWHGAASTGRAARADSR